VWVQKVGDVVELLTLSHWINISCYQQ